MSNPAKIAVGALKGRAESLMAERWSVRRELLELAVRDIAIEQAIQGCIGGAKALGESILPVEGYPNVLASEAHPLHKKHTLFIQARDALATLARDLAPFYSEEPQIVTSSEPLANEGPKEMPRIADIILAELKKAADRGTKASSIRKFISDMYHVDVHEKTVGMTLYRLQRDGRVKRTGHTWFLAPHEAKSPGAATPGPVNSQT